MLQGEHSAILSTFMKLPFVNKIFVLSIFEWLLKTGFTVLIEYYNSGTGRNSHPEQSIIETSLCLHGNIKKRVYIKTCPKRPLKKKTKSGL